MKKSLRLLFLGLLGLLTACSSTMDVTRQNGALPQGARWALLPIANHTAEPQAGLRAEAITESLLRVRGVTGLQRYPAELNTDSVFVPAERKLLTDAQEWARKEGIRYAVTGAVDEWRYKVGVDGEPAVGLTLQVIDLQSGSVVWAAAGAKSGHSRQAVSAVAQGLVRDMLGKLSLKPGAK